MKKSLIFLLMVSFPIFQSCNFLGLIKPQGKASNFVHNVNNRGILFTVDERITENGRTTIWLKGDKYVFTCSTTGSLPKYPMGEQSILIEQAKEGIQNYILVYSHQKQTPAECSANTDELDSESMSYLRFVPK